ACPARGEAATVAVDVPVRFVLLRAFGLKDVGAVARAEVDLGRLGRARGSRDATPVRSGS
ncbi:MAG: hypothetical protein ACRDPR_02400, partial [Nocardioidaceae bacterium]